MTERMLAELERMERRLALLFPHMHMIQITDMAIEMIGAMPVDLFYD